MKQALSVVDSTKSSDSHSPWTPKVPKRQEDNYQSIRYHISRLNDKEYQIVITDVKGNYDNSQKFARKIYDKILKDYQDYGFYIWLELSGTGPPSAWKKAGNVFGILLLLSIFAAIVYLANRSSKRQFVQARESVRAHFSTLTSMG